MKPLNPARIGRPLVLLCLFAVLSATAHAGREVPDFTLTDLAGHSHQLQRAGGRAVVLFFTGTGCPIARKSIPKLKAIEDRFGPEGVSTWIINAYPEDTRRDILKEVDELGLHRATYLRDPIQGVALALGVQRTAEVAVISTADWKVIYQGAIDDQLSEGAELPEPRQKFLETALTEFLSGRPITQPRTTSHGCRLAYAGTAGEAPSYSRDIAPLLKKNCVACHREGALAPWAMDGHARVKNNAAMIEEVLLTRRMPPWSADPDFGHFSNDPRLSREETQTLLRWVAAGSPRGEGPDPLTDALPALGAWTMGNPDVVIRLPEVQQVPATGVLEYRQIPIPSPFTNGVWIAGMEVKPGNRKVVHHAILYAKWPGCPDGGTGKGVHLYGWAPGTPSLRYPDGVGKYLPAGAELTMEMHYTTCGSPQTDQTELAFQLLPGAQSRQAETRQAIQLDLDIPPGSDEARHTATYAFERPATIYLLAPHMHVRGKWMRYELLRPDGKKTTLLHVPRYDFQWQLGYMLKEPLHVPAGSWLLVTGAFDNSTGNPANPDPKKRVHFGLQSWDEMFIGFFDAADDPAPVRAEAPGSAPAGGQP
ncbi:MAG: redoxin family protein [Verrucomicrobiales bacterium]|nr:redoxin family protein [Verrucomicrobiales bacterium]